MTDFFSNPLGAISNGFANGWNWLGDGARTAGDSVLGKSGLINKLTDTVTNVQGKMLTGGLSNLAKGFGVPPQILLVVAAIIVIIIVVVLAKTMI